MTYSEVLSTLSYKASTMQDLYSKAIVLRSFFFKDKQKILTLFSERFGLISMVLKGVSSKKPSILSLSESFSEGEYVFSKDHSNLFKFQDGSLLNLHLPLRNKLCFLKTASCMSTALLKSQMPEKAAPLLYALFSSFLKQIPSFSSQETLLGCFYLKLLKHEGLYHSEYEEFPLNSEEQQMLLKITSLPNFLLLKELTLPSPLFLFIENLFFQKIS